MKDFLLYDVWGTFMEYIIPMAISVYIGYLINKSFSKKENIKKYSKVLSIIIALIIFSLFVYSFNK